MMAQDDETVANLATEALAVSLGAQLLSAEARYVGDLDRHEASSGAAVSGNFVIGNDSVTRLLRVFDPADHGLLLSAAGRTTSRRLYARRFTRSASRARSRIPSRRRRPRWRSTSTPSSSA